MKRLNRMLLLAGLTGFIGFTGLTGCVVLDPNSLYNQAKENAKKPPLQAPSAEKVYQVCGDITKKEVTPSYRYFIPFDWGSPAAERHNNPVSLMTYNGAISFCDCTYNMVQLRLIFNKPELVPLCMSRFQEVDGGVL